MGTTLMQKTGQVERTIDREFAEEEGRYRTWVAFFNPRPCWTTLTSQHGEGDEQSAEGGEDIPRRYAG